MQFSLLASVDTKSMYPNFFWNISSACWVNDMSENGTYDYNCWIPGSGYPTHHFLGTVTTVDISKKCYIQTSNAIQEWTEKYWECLVMVLIKSTGTNLEYIQILYMVSVYISINILTSNITYGNIPKSYYICKEIYITSKKDFLLMEMAKFRYHCNTLPCESLPFLHWLSRGCV